MIFITWFGATGYLLRESGTVIVLTLLIATMIGLLGAALAWIFLAKVLWRGQTQLDPYNYRLEGAVGRVSSTIRAGGTGEIVYHLDGKQRVDGARSNDGSAIPAGSDVVILRFANGIAYVAPQTVSFDGEPLPFEAEAGPAPTPLPAPPTAGEERHETRA
jgi:membrane protein implicated in regulation of membrane protease activity